MPKVSVIVPVHNAGKYLIPLINSIIYQTFKDLEIFLIDDGSTDGSRDIIKQFEKMDQRITAIFREVEPYECFGQKYSADLGRSLATGKYVMIIDHDDELTLNAIETLYSYTDNETIDVVQGRNRSINDAGDIVYRTPNYWPEPTMISNIDELPEEILLLHLVYAPVASWACLIRNEFLKDLQLSDCIFNDTDFIWQLKIKAKTFIYIPEEVYIYHHHFDSTSGGKDQTIVHNMFLIMDYLKEFLQQQNISEKIWDMYYVYKFYSLYKMKGLAPQIKLKYYKDISKAIRNDKNISPLLMLLDIGQDFLTAYILLKNYNEDT